jgi:hypothetical protein
MQLSSGESGSHSAPTRGSSTENTHLLEAEFIDIYMVRCMGPDLAREGRRVPPK